MDGNSTALNNRKHLLFLTPGFPNDEDDSRCIPALQLFLSELAKRELFHISVIAFHYPYEPKSYEWRTIRVHALGGKNQTGFRRVLLLQKAMRLAKKLGKVDWVHSFWLGECAWLGNRIAKQLNITHSCTLMGQDVLKENNYLKRLRTKPLLVALSAFQAAVYAESTAQTVDFIIPWGMEKRAQSAPAVKSIDVIGVGWLNEVKDFDRFLQLIKKIKEHRPGIQAEIIGEGTKKEVLQQQLRELGLETTVCLIGGVEREETLKRISQARILLHTSQFESFGMVFIEAQAMGTKIISTPVGIVNELEEATIFKTDEEAVNSVCSYLASEKEQQSKVVFRIEDTVDSYLNNVFLTPKERD